MSDADFISYREAQQKRRAERLPRRTKLINDLSNYGFRVQRITDYQFRVTKAGSKKKIDIYPIHLRFHDIKSGIRGQIPGEKKLREFITKKLI
jgi:hypothetical protein